MTTADRIENMLNHLTVPETEEAVETWLAGLPRVEAPSVVSFVNAHAVNLMVKDKALFDALTQSDTLLRDGSGMKMMMRLFGRSPGENLNGTDLIPRIIGAFTSEKSKRKRVAVIATQQPWLDKACDVIRAQGADIVLTMDGFQSEEAYVKALMSTPADLIILGMGMPKQEKVSMKLADAISHPCVIVNGGAIIDFLADRFPRAPESWRKLGLEWLYRLTREPKRLFQRYVVGNAVFLGRAALLKAGGRGGV